MKMASPALQTTELQVLHHHLGQTKPTTDDEDGFTGLTDNCRCRCCTITWDRQNPQQMMKMASPALQTTELQVLHHHLGQTKPTTDDEDGFTALQTTAAAGAAPSPGTDKTHNR